MHICIGLTIIEDITYTTSKMSVMLGVIFGLGHGIVFDTQTPLLVPPRHTFKKVVISNQWRRLGILGVWGQITKEFFFASMASWFRLFHFICSFV